MTFFSDTGTDTDNSKTVTKISNSVECRNSYIYSLFPDEDALDLSKVTGLGRGKIGTPLPN